jgi:polyhydroxyalkanoate synthesis repressor PhaR
MAADTDTTKGPEKPAADNKGGEKPSGEKGAPVRIKKYANRRLYNTSTSSYVTLDYLAQMVRNGVDFTVEDAKTSEDITRSVLTQIIVEEEAKGQNMLPINFLRQLISLYGDNLQFLVPRYLEQSMESFAKNQEQMRSVMQESFGGILPLQRFEEMSKQNMTFFEQAMQLWNPFKMANVPAGLGGHGGGQAGAAPANGPAKPGEPTSSADLTDLKTQMQALQRQLDALAKAGSGKPE